MSSPALGASKQVSSPVAVGGKGLSGCHRSKKVDWDRLQPPRGNNFPLFHAAQISPIEEGTQL